MAKDDLTPKQEAFALAYVETGNAAEAYRRAYDVKAATQHSSIYTNASKLLDNAKVMQRVRDLQAQAADMCLYTVKDAFTEYEVARQLALEQENPSAAVSAVTGKVKLFGLDQPTKIDHTTNGKDMPADNTASLRIMEKLDAIEKRSREDGGAPA